jgi:hypothetical protein
MEKFLTLKGMAGVVKVCQDVLRQDPKDNLRQPTLQAMTVRN